MKQQLVRLSPHQNAKVFAVMMAASSLVFAVPIMLLASMFGMQSASPPVYMILVLPLFYLVIGYVATFIGCLAYNFFFRFVGGIEFETESV